MPSRTYTFDQDRSTSGFLPNLDVYNPGRMTAEDSSQNHAGDGPVYSPAVEAFYYLIGRRILDGANLPDLPALLGVDRAVIEEGWRVSQEQLSLDIALRDKTENHTTENRLRSLEELKAEAAYCLRRLLAWREKLLAQAAIDTTPQSSSEQTPEES